MPRAKRRLGQHFLTDPGILGRIADSVGSTPNDTVLEIGPGPGGLTRALAERSGRVVAIEKDRDLAALLRAELPAVEVIEGDALTIDWHAYAGPRYLVAGNIPYNITSPLLDKALTPPMPERIVFLVQQEVASRVTARPGTPEYGALTVGVQAIAVAEKLFAVPAGAFHPRPKVDSAVLRLSPRPDPLIGDRQRDSFRTAVVGLFGFRRKQLLRGVRELTGWGPEQAGRVLAAARIAVSVRPEVLGPPDFVRLHAALVDEGWKAR